MLLLQQSFQEIRCASGFCFCAEERKSMCGRFAVLDLMPKAELWINFVLRIKKSQRPQHSLGSFRYMLHLERCSAVCQGLSGDRKVQFRKQTWNLPHQKGEVSTDVRSTLSSIIDASRFTSVGHFVCLTGRFFGSSGCLDPAEATDHWIEYTVHPWKLTWNPKMKVWEDEFPFQTGDFQVPC